MKIVSFIPMTNLWLDNENIVAKREKYLSAKEIQEKLKNNPIEFVVASIGEKLNWVSFDKSFNFWKTELKPHLVDDINNINLNAYPNNYAYIASEWSREIETSIILFEKYH